MGTFNMAVQSAPSSSGPTLLPHSSHRTALKPPNQVRWPVNLNHLAAISLEDDSDLDHSFSDVSKENIGSVKLLRFLKDSDDESASAVDSPSRLRRPRSTYASLSTGQQKLLPQRVGIPVARSSSLHGTSSSQSSGGNTGIPKPQQRSRTGPIAVRPTGLRHHQSETVLVGPKHQVASENPEDMEQIFSEANAVAQRLGGATGIRAPGVKNTSSSGPVNMLRRPAASQNTSPSSPATSTPSLAGNQLQARTRISAPPKTLKSSSSTTSLKRASLQGTAGSRQDPRLTASPRDKDTPSTRIPGSPGSIQTTPSARKLVGLQQPPLSRPVAPNTNVDGQIANSLPPPPPIGSGTAIDPDSNRIIQELKNELEYWKAEVSVCGQERATAETWRKQISDLERDLGVALESLSTAEAKVIDAKSEREAIDSRIANYEKTIESLKTELGIERTQNEKALEEATASQRQQLETLETSNRELEKKLAQAQDEIDQLELQVVPADLQDVHQSLFSATQELEEVKRRNEKLSIDLSEEKAKVAREQEDAGQLLVKLSQLQDAIANHLRDNNALKEIVREHEKCQENAETVEYQHKKELGRLQSEMLAHQQGLTQEKDQKTRIEQALQEQQYQALQFQQQVQLQQTQLLQQQTEIVNLRVALEVEQKQSALLQQRLQEEQRLRNTQFGRRVSSDGELNGSFFMVETSNGGMHPGIPMNMTAGGPDAMVGALGGTMAQPIPAVGPNAMSSTATNSLMSSSFQSARSFDASSPSMLTSQFGMNQVQAAPTAALPPIGNSMVSNATSSGGMVGLMGVAGTGDIEPKSSMHNRGSSGSFHGIFSTGNMNANRLSAQGDSSASSGSNAGSNAIPTVEELTAQLQHLMKEKERLQAELSKIPISGGGPMTRRKAEVLEEQMDETVQAIGKLRYSIRMRS